VEPIEPQPGSPIDPRNAVGRRGVTDAARRELLRGNNLALTDPRRMGKTVWLDLFCAGAGDGLIAVKIDYEGVQSTDEFLGRTLKELRAFAPLPARARGRLAAFFDGWDVSVGPVSVKPSLTHLGTLEMLNVTIEAIAEAMAADTKLVIAMDEVPMAISNIAAAEDADAAGRLLQVLRSIRRNHPQIGWIVCGSIGFHHVLRRCGVTEGVLNDLVNLPLGPFDEEEAIELAHRLTLGIKRSATMDVVARIADRAGRIPFLIHALAHRLEDSGTGPLSDADVDQAFDDFVHDRDESRAITHLVTRLEIYGDLAASAEQVLDHVATQAPVLEAALAELVPTGSTIIDDLVDDHYLRRLDEGLVWRYEVLRVVWVARQGLS